MTTVTTRPQEERKTKFQVWRSRHGWTVGVWLLLIVLVAWYAALLPKFGAFQITSGCKTGLTYFGDHRNLADPIRYYRVQVDLSFKI